MIRFPSYSVSLFTPSETRTCVFSSILFVCCGPTAHLDVHKIYHHLEYRYVSSSPALGWTCWFCPGAVISPSPAVPPPSSLYGRFLESPPAWHFLASDQSASCSFRSSVCSRASGSYCSQGLKYSRSVCVCVCVCVRECVCLSFAYNVCLSGDFGHQLSLHPPSSTLGGVCVCVCMCVVVINSWIHNEVTSICAAAETVSKKNQQDVCRLCPLFSSETIWERHISQSCRSRWTSYRLGGDLQYIHLFLVQNTVSHATTATNCNHRHPVMPSSIQNSI